MELMEWIGRIRPVNEAAGQACRERWDAIAKPLRGLGLLEEAVVRIAAATGNPHPEIARRALVVMCADNGVVAEGVTQTGSDVTAVVTENFAKGATSACAMARVANCRVVPVDMGVARDVNGEIIRHKIAYGTKNMVREPAMTRAQAEEAVLFGMGTARKLGEEGVQILATGEMGIGNTTTSAAVASVLLGRPPAELTGRGAGLDNAGLERKIRAIQSAIALHRPDPADPLDVLAKVGGFDLAGLCGVFLGGALCGIPVLADGFISVTAALCAVRLCPKVQGYVLASHVSKEPAAKLLLDALRLRPLITAEMCLGEGTGAVAALPLLDMALAVYNDMPTFQEIQIAEYKDLTQK